MKPAARMSAAICLAIAYCTITSSGCRAWSWSDPNALSNAQERSGVDSFPVRNLHPPEPAQPPQAQPAAPNLVLSYGDEAEDGLIYFAHTNERLHYKKCLARIQEVLEKTTGPVNLEIRSGKRDLSWELQFGYELRELKGFDRLQVYRQQATSAANVGSAPRVDGRATKP